MAYIPNFNDTAYGWDTPQYQGVGGVLGALRSGQPTGVFGGGQSPWRQLLAPEVALPMAAAMIAGKTPQESLAGAFAQAGPALGNAKKKAAFNKWFKAGAPRDPSDPAFQELLQTAPDIAEKYAATQLGASGQTEYGMTPVWGKDANGKTVLMQMSNRGGITPVDTHGVEPLDPSHFVNTGTEVLQVGSRTGDVRGGPIKIDVAGKAREQKSGEAQGDAIAAYRSIESKLPGIDTVVKQLDALADKATYTIGGQVINEAMRQAGMEPREAAVARTEYIAMVDNQILPLLRDTFGSQFTAREGDTLRATLGDPNKTPQEKKAVLRTFIEQKRRDAKALAEQAGLGVKADTPSGANGAGGAPGLSIGGPPVQLAPTVTIRRIE